MDSFRAGRVVLGLMICHQGNCCKVRSCGSGEHMGKEKVMHYIYTHALHWVGQKIHSGFSITVFFFFAVFFFIIVVDFVIH